jgi:hypothetical protein
MKENDVFMLEMARGYMNIAITDLATCVLPQHDLDIVPKSKVGRLDGFPCCFLQNWMLSSSIGVALCRHHALPKYPGRTCVHGRDRYEYTNPLESVDKLLFITRNLVFVSKTLIIDPDSLSCVVLLKFRANHANKHLCILRKSFS